MTTDAERMLTERKSSNQLCSSTAPKTSKGCGPHEKRRRKQQEAKLPLGSVLVGNIAGQQLRLATDFTAISTDFDWLQQSVGAVNHVKHLLAGALSAVFSKTCTAPLERVKLEMQLTQRHNSIAVARELWTGRGPLDFWKGNGLNLLRVTPHKAVNFFSFYMYRTALAKMSKEVDTKGIDRFLAGALAGSTATLLCFPLDVIRTRVMSTTGEISARKVVRKMVAQEGLGALYVGCLPAVVSTAASGAIFYGVYDLLKDNYFRSQVAKGRRSEDDIVLSAGRTLLYGALAGAAAESVLYPLEVLRRRMQLQSMQATKVMVNAQEIERITLAAATERGVFAEVGRQSAPHVHRMAAAALKQPYLAKLMNAAVEIYKMDGLSGFYSGIAPHILQVLPSAALSYYFYEACKRALKVEEEH